MSGADARPRMLAQRCCARILRPRRLLLEPHSPLTARPSRGRRRRACRTFGRLSAILGRSRAPSSPGARLILRPRTRPRSAEVLSFEWRHWSPRMQILVLGGDGYLGWPTALHLSAAGHDVAVNDNFARRGYDEEMGVDSLVPIATLDERIAAWTDVSGKTIKAYVGDLCDPDFTHAMVGDFRPAGDRPLRRAARRAVLDDRPGPRRLHADQQRRRHAQRDVRDRRHRHRHPPRQARDDGRVRHAQHRHRGGVDRDRAQGPQGPHDLPQAPGLLLPLLEGPRQHQHRVRLPHLGHARHRPQPGCRVRRRHRADRARPQARDAL